MYCPLHLSFLQLYAMCTGSQQLCSLDGASVRYNVISLGVAGHCLLCAPLPYHSAFINRAELPCALPCGTTRKVVLFQPCMHPCSPKAMPPRTCPLTSHCAQVHVQHRASNGQRSQLPYGRTDTVLCATAHGHAVPMQLWQPASSPPARGRDHNFIGCRVKTPTVRYEERYQDCPETNVAS